MRIGAFHVYIALIGLFFSSFAVIYNNFFMGLIGFIIVAIYVSAGVEFFMKVEEANQK